MSSTAARRPWVLALILTGVSAIAWAQAPKPNTDTGGTDREVRAAQQQMLQAAIKGDKDEVSRLMADDVTWIGLNGKLIGKDQVVATLPAPVKSVDVQQVLPMSKTAILTGLAHMNDGTESRFLQEWVNRDGEWKLMAHEGTRVVAAGAPAAGGTTGMSPTGTAGTGGGPTVEARTVAPTLNSDEERAVWKAQTEIVEAYGRGDTKAYSRLTANPFTRIETKGQVYDRRQWLALVGKNVKQPLKPGAVSDVQIQVDSANNTARVTLQLVPFAADGTPEPPERQTRIFSLRNGQWQQVAAISAPIPQQ